MKNGRSKMAHEMMVSGNYGTHLPCLIKALSKTTGDVLELGIGIFSTPYLHYQCLLSKRHLISIDNESGWVRRFADSEFSAYLYRGKYHDFIHVKNWSDAPIEKPWDVVLVDQTPDSSRTETIKRLIYHAKYIIIHDSNPSNYGVTHYDKIYPLFKYKTDWNGDNNRATIISNLVDLEDFWK